MVTKYTAQGNPYQEPPYTAAEEAEFYRRVGGGPVSVVKLAAAVSPRKPQPQPPKTP
jgi:hypothetical protein